MRFTEKEESISEGHQGKVVKTEGREAKGEMGMGKSGGGGREGRVLEERKHPERRPTC